MGPRPFSHGYEKNLEASKPKNCPSMGPRPFSHGYLNPPISRRYPCPPSMGPRPFSHGYRLVQRLRAELHVPSMGPRPFSHGYLITFVTRHLHNAILQWGHGLSAMDTISCTRRRCTRPTFNGATAFQPWILQDYTDWQFGVLALQWGHGLSAMDTPENA